MPYRRLPNTDSARIKALKTALKRGKELPPFKLAFSQKTLQSILSFLPGFEHCISVQKQFFSYQAEKSKDYHHHFRKARLYISHFIQVMNMAIFRGELPPSTRRYFGFEEEDKTLPPLNTEQEVVEWGKKVIEGESDRIMRGYSHITNPTVAVVKVRYEKFMEAVHFQKTIHQRNQLNQDNLVLQRKNADILIQNIWNEVEEHYKDLPDDLRRDKAKEYGLVYVFRKNEVKNLSVFLNEKKSIC